MVLSDQALVEKVKREDFDAFTALVNRYEGKVYRLAMRMLRNQEDAEDALQETFLQVHRGMKNFEGRSSFSTWLFRLATNVCLMKIRDREIDPSKVLPLEEYLPQHGEGKGPSAPEWPKKPEEVLLSKESRGKMLEAMEALPPDYRAVFILRDIEGFSNAETGEALGLSVAAVKSRLHRARMSLRAKLSVYFSRNPA